MQSFPEKTLNELKKHLEDEQKRIAARIRELTQQDPFSDPDRTIDNAASDEEASEESNHDRVDALVTELKDQLTNIEQALIRIEKGTYGFCTNCGKMIDTDRLAVLPTATLCLECESAKKKV